MAVRLKAKFDELNKRLDRLGQTAQAREETAIIVIYDPANPDKAVRLLSGPTSGQVEPKAIFLLPDNGRDSLNELERQEQEQEAGFISQQPGPGPQPGRAAPVGERPGPEPEPEFMLFETWFRIYYGKPGAADWEDPHKYFEELPPKKYMMRVK